MMKVYSLGSGSKGNCMVVTNGKNSVLIDAGLSPRTTMTKLSQVGILPHELDAVLVTHEHSDHIRSIAEIAAVAPVYSHTETLDAIGKIVPLPYKQTMEVDEKGFRLGSMDVTPFRVSHDAVYPFGFVIKDEDDSVCYMTDTGYIGKGMMRMALGCNKVVLESNHDKEMLIRGAYPEYLKRRILSDTGHLCNEESALTCGELAKNGTKKILLAHLSENNNLSELAYWTTRSYLEKCGAGKEVTLKVAAQKDTVLLS